MWFYLEPCLWKILCGFRVLYKALIILYIYIVIKQVIDQVSSFLHVCNIITVIMMHLFLVKYFIFLWMLNNTIVCFFFNVLVAKYSNTDS